MKFPVMLRARENQDAGKTKLGTDVIQAAPGLQDCVAEHLFGYAKFVGPEQAVFHAFGADLDLAIEFRGHAT